MTACYEGGEFVMSGLKAFKSTVGALSVGCILLASNAHAAFTLYVSQSGADVVASGTGTLNVSQLTLEVPGDSGDCGSGPYATFPYICSGPGTGPATNTYGSITGPSSFGTTNAPSAWTGTGDIVGIKGSSLVVPFNYLSGAALTSSSNWNATTLDGLGLTLGTYTWTWGTGAGADSFTLVIGSAPPVATPATVPTLSEYAMVALASLMAMGGIWMMRKRGKI
jgi:hypothetical protein